MKEVGYVSVNNIMSKFIRDTGLDIPSESDMIEWTADALEAIGCVNMLEECVSFYEVKNHSANLPIGVESIIQIARNRDWSNLDKKNDMTVEKLSCQLPENPYEEGSCDKNVKYIPVDADTNHPIFNEDRYEYKPNVNVLMEYVNWKTSDYYEQSWTPVRLKNHSFFNTLVCQEEDGLYTHSKDEYTLVGNRVIRTSFKEGQIAIAYYRQMLDEDGYPMVPDHYAYTTAITKYITMMLMQREFYASRKGATQKLQKAEMDWQNYCGQAGARSMMPNLDQLENMLRQRQHLLPKQNRYSEFFKDLSQRENRVYNDPDGRNHHNYFRRH